MTGHQISRLVDYGATDRVRKYLKKLGIYQRLTVLNECVPHVKSSPKSLKFFKENFSIEIGAILMAEHDLKKAESLYRSSKSYK